MRLIFIYICHWTVEFCTNIYCHLNFCCTAMKNNRQTVLMMKQKLKKYQLLRYVYFYMILCNSFPIAFNFFDSVITILFWIISRFVDSNRLYSNLVTLKTTLWSVSDLWKIFWINIQENWNSRFIDSIIENGKLATLASKEKTKSWNPEDVIIYLYFYKGKSFLMRKKTFWLFFNCFLAYILVIYWMNKVQ